MSLAVRLSLRHSGIETAAVRAGVSMVRRRAMSLSTGVPALPGAVPDVAKGISSMLAQQDRMSVIQAHDRYGFTVNGIHMRGSVLVFPNYTLLWNCQRLVDVCPRNTAIVHMVRPKIELLLLGTGVGENVNPSLFAYFQRRGVSVEPMATAHAIATFNTLVAEGRRVAVGLVSRTSVSRDDACLYSPEWAGRESEADRRLKQALRRDPYGEGSQRLLSGEAEAQSEAAASNAANGTAAAASPVQQYMAEAEQLSAQYGYPGAMLDAPDLSLALTEEQRRERMWRRTAGGPDDARKASGRPGGRAPRKSDDAALAYEWVKRNTGGGSDSS